MNPNDAPENAIRVTFSFWTEAPYSKSERDDLKKQLAAFVNEFDDDILPTSHEIHFETQDGIIVRAKHDLKEMLDTGKATVSVEFKNDDVDNLTYEFGGDNSES